MQSINNRTQVRRSDEQRAAPDARMVSAVAGRECDPPPPPSARLSRPFATSNSSSSPRTHPTTPGHPPLRSGAGGVVFRTSPPPKQRPGSSPSTTRLTAAPTTATTKRGPLPPSFPLFFGAAGNQSSASIAPSTAEARPARVNGGTAALRELNTNFPSNVYRHISAKSSGAQSTTYSQPVIVRTYNGPYSGGTKRNNSGSRPVTTRTPLPAGVDFVNADRAAHNSGQASPDKNSSNDSSNKRDGSDDGSDGKENGVVNNLWTSTNKLTSKPKMPRHHPPPPKKRGFPLTLPWQRSDRSSVDDGTNMPAAERPKYPPLEAFTMKGIIQAQRSTQSELDVSLDQIAELYARSRYSLSNQYEVHVTPHGSGIEFGSSGAVSAIGGGRRKAGSTTSSGGGLQNPGSHRSGSVRRYHHQMIGPTLQATWSEDEADESSVGTASVNASGAARSHRKRRGGAAGQRRKSAAYGTLETIMSSSRSSSEDKEKKKSASELTEEVRGRAERAAGRKHGKYGEGGASGQQAATTTVAHEIDGRQVSNQDDDKTRDQRTGGGAAGSPNKRKGSASFAHAMIDSSRSRHDTTSPRGSALALVSEPALPQTSTGEVQSRTTVAPATDETEARRRPGEPISNGSQRLAREAQAQDFEASHAAVTAAVLPAQAAGRRNSLLKQEPVTAVVATAATAQDPRGGGGGLLAGLNGWIPWRASTASQTQQQQPSAATDGLRDLLKSVDKKTAKGKGVERLG